MLRIYPLLGQILLFQTVILIFQQILLQYHRQAGPTDIFFIYINSRVTKHVNNYSRDQVQQKMRK